MIPRTVQEIRDAILQNMGIGMDTNDGSLASVIAGAVAQQCVTMERNLRSIKLHDHPIFNDLESLALQGRSLGLFKFDPESIKFEIITNTELNEGETLVAVDTRQHYTVTDIVEEGGNKYYLESEQKGANETVFPYKWYEEVYFTKLTDPNNPIRANVTQILEPGRDEESTDAFRARVYAATMTLPFAGNAAFFKTHLIQKFRGIRCVRIELAHPLTPTSWAEVRLYLGDGELNPATLYTRKQAQKEVHDFVPIGMTVNVYPVVKTKNTDLKFKIEYKTGTFGISPDAAKNEIIKKLQTELINLTINTDPTQRIKINTPVYQGMIADMIKMFVSDVSLTIDYNPGTGFVSHKDEFSLEIKHVPWAYADNVELVMAGAMPINYIPGA